MERERGSKVIAIVALCVGIVGLSLGFAAFSSNLVINSSANVTPNAGEFSVVFTDATTGQVSAVEGVATTGVIASTPTVDTQANAQGATTSTIGDLSATFNAPGQSVTWTFSTENVGKFLAYLNSVAYVNPDSASTFKVCTPGVNTTAEYVNATQEGAKGACDDIELTFAIDDTEYNATDANISSKTLPVGEKHTVEVTISYNKVDGQTLSDGDFSVAFGDIQIGYGSQE